MSFSPPSITYRAGLPYRFIAGHPSRDFVNTVDWAADGLQNDRLVAYGDVVRWSHRAGLVSARRMRALAAAAADEPAEEQLALEATRYARWVLRRVLVAAAAGKSDARALVAFNELLHDATRRLVLEQGRAADTSPFRWTWRSLDDSLESPLWVLTWAAGNLLTSSEAALVRECGGDACGWLFVDRSRNGLRRWCDMRTCGTRAKSRRRAARGGAAR